MKMKSPVSTGIFSRHCSRCGGSDTTSPVSSKCTTTTDSTPDLKMRSASSLSYSSSPLFHVTERTDTNSHHCNAQAIFYTARRPSIMASLRWNGGCKKDPHKLATLAALDVKENFRASLPTNLQYDYDNRDCIASFDSEEIQLGPLLGTGEFSNVYEVESFHLKLSVPKRLSREESSMRWNMKRHEQHRNTGESRYALKHLKAEILKECDPLDYAQAAR